jgi:hypothetical protein
LFKGENPFPRAMTFVLNRSDSRERPWNSTIR